MHDAVGVLVACAEGAVAFAVDLFAPFSGKVAAHELANPRIHAAAGAGFSMLSTDQIGKDFVARRVVRILCVHDLRWAAYLSVQGSSDIQ